MRMNPLLLSAAALYGAAGLSLTFAPAEILAITHAPSPAIFVWVAQLLGAGLLGLAMLNYLHRYSVVGGILGRPVLMANLSFLAVSFFASLNSWRHEGGVPYLLVTIIAGILLVSFGFKLFAPSRTASPERENNVLPN